MLVVGIGHCAYKNKISHEVLSFFCDCDMSFFCAGFGKELGPRFRLQFESFKSQRTPGSQRQLHYGIRTQVRNEQARRIEGAPNLSGYLVYSFQISSPFSTIFQASPLGLYSTGVYSRFFNVIHSFASRHIVSISPLCIQNSTAIE